MHEGVRYRGRRPAPMPHVDPNTQESLSMPILTDDPDDRRRRFGAASNSFRAVVEVGGDAMCAVLDALPATMTAPLAPTVGAVEEAVQGTMRSFAKPYDDGAHFSLLCDLWAALHDRTSGGGIDAARRLGMPPDAVSERWKTWGFQGTDPRTDLRGGGVCALHHLIHFAKFYAHACHRIAGENEYPLAAAGINVTMHLLVVMGVERGRSMLRPTSTYTLAWARKNLLTMLSEAETVEERMQKFGDVFAVAMDVLDQEWRRGERSIMAFNDVLARATRRFCRILRRSASVGDLMEHTTVIA